MSAARHADDESMLTLVSCPQCGECASIEWQAVDAGMHYLKTHCVQGHWFLLPSNLVNRYATTEPVGTTTHRRIPATPDLPATAAHNPTLRCRPPAPPDPAVQGPVRYLQNLHLASDGRSDPRGWRS